MVNRAASDGRGRATDISPTAAPLGPLRASPTSSASGAGASDPRGLALGLPCRAAQPLVGSVSVLGERRLRLILQEFVWHYNAERNHIWQPLDRDRLISECLHAEGSPVSSVSRSEHQVALSQTSAILT